MPYYDDVPQHLPSPAAGPLQQRQARKRRRGGISLLVLLLVTALIGVGSWYLLAGQFTTTPNFSKLGKAAATELATENGLMIAWDEDFSETVPVGQVMRTDPGTGDRVRRGGTVTAFLSKGPERYPVPSLAGRSPEDAKRALEEVNLKAGKQVEVYHESVPVGTVVSGSIEASKPVKPGTVVDLNVSKGPAPVKIVSFKNKPFTEAEAFYKNAGLNVQRAEDKYDGKIVAGNVISSDPKTGSSVPRKGTITFTVSKGPEMITIPGVRGLSQKAATVKLTNLDFKVDVKRALPFGSTALGTNPGEGQQAPKGSTITLFVG